MNKTFQIITTVLIVILMFLLVWVFISYYKESSEPITPTYTIPAPSDKENNVDVGNKNNQIIPEIGGETDKTGQADNTANNEQPNVNENPVDINNVPAVENPPKENVQNTLGDDKGIIMSSSTTISNAEKQKVLSEIDNTLNELLKVVDKVTTVDETRLNVDIESEVQP